LALDAPRRCRLVLQALRRDPPGAALTRAVRALADPLQRVLHLLAVRVEKVDEEIRGRAVG